MNLFKFLKSFQSIGFYFLIALLLLANIVVYFYLIDPG